MRQEVALLVDPEHYHQRYPGLPPARAGVSQAVLVTVFQEVGTPAHAGVSEILKVWA